MKDQSSRKQVARKEVKKAAPKMEKTAQPLGGNSASGRPRIDLAGRQKLIAQAAYLRAERRGFAPGFESQDWLEAEAEIRRLLES